MFQAELRAAEVYPNFQKKTSIFAVSQKTDTATIFKISLQKRISVSSLTMRIRWFILEPKFWKLWPYLFLWHLIFLLTDRILSHSPNFGRPKQGPKKILNFFSEYWVRKDFLGVSPKNFPIENFRVRSNLRKSSVFYGYPCPYPQKKDRACVPKILMPPTDLKFVATVATGTRVNFFPAV